ncbi:MAG TPA: hypothetical protein VGR24_01915 [bacterium]|jgi:hypothetical protein|nr:hypothetical protein [bacterium]
MDQASGAPVPLTERILTRLPGPRLAWVLIWSAWFGLTLVPLFAYGFYPQAGGDIDAEGALLFSTLFVYSNILSIWGIRRIQVAVSGLRENLVALDAGREDAFSAIGRTWGPVIISAVISLTFMAEEIFGTPSVVDAVATLSFLVGILPIATMLWVYGAVLWELNRLGTRELRFAPFEEDRSLGLRPFGRLAFQAFGVFVAAFFPLSVADLNEPKDIVFNVVIYSVILGLLFLSVARLREQLVRARSAHMRWARKLYGEAFRSATAGGTGQIMREHAPELQVAAEAERAAAAIQTWPFDASAFRAIGAVMTSVITAMIVRLVLSRVGL